MIRLSTTPTPLRLAQVVLLALMCCCCWWAAADGQKTCTSHSTPGAESWAAAESWAEGYTPCPSDKVCLSEAAAATAEPEAVAGAMVVGETAHAATVTLGSIPLILAADLVLHGEASPPEPCPDDFYCSPSLCKVREGMGTV